MALNNPLFLLLAMASFMAIVRLSVKSSATGGGEVESAEFVAIVDPSFGQMEYSEFMAIVPPPPNEESVSAEYAKECPANETLSPWGDPYSPKCTDRPGPKPLSLVATNPECVCLEGFARNATSQCISREDCPPNNDNGGEEPRIEDKAQNKTDPVADE